MKTYGVQCARECAVRVGRHVPWLPALHFPAGSVKSDRPATLEEARAMRSASKMTHPMHTVGLFEVTSSALVEVADD